MFLAALRILKFTPHTPGTAARVWVCEAGLPVLWLVLTDEGLRKKQARAAGTQLAPSLETALSLSGKGSERVTSIWKVCVSESLGFVQSHTAKGRKRQDWISDMQIVHLPFSA